MKCARCGREASEDKTTEAAELRNGGLLAIRHIPCCRCGRCGEVMYTGDVVQRMEDLTGRAEASAQEITVLNYARAS